MAEVACAHRQASALDREPGRPRARRDAADARSRLVTQINADVQKAGAAMQADDYAAQRRRRLLSARSKERLRRR